MGRRATKGKERVIRKKSSKVVAQSGENVPFYLFSILILFSPGKVRSDKIQGVVLYGFVAEGNFVFWFGA